MRNLLTFVHRINLLVWILGIFIGHALMYLLLGTDTWLFTTFLATAFYAVLLYVLKWAARRMMREKGEAR